MTYLRRMWHELKRGENLDLYVTVIAAVTIAALNLFGIGQAYTMPLTLAVLALLALSILGSRHQNQELVQALAETAERVFQDEFPPSLKADFAAATEVWMVGVTLATPIDVYYSLLQTKLKQGHVIKVLMVQPDSPAVAMAEMRAFGRPNAARTNATIVNHLSDFCDLRTLAPDRMEIRTIAHPLGHGLVAVNPDSAAGVLYISNYPFRTAGGSLPKLVLRPQDGKWYELYRQELHNLWEAAQEWSCSESP